MRLLTRKDNLIETQGRIYLADTDPEATRVPRPRLL
jgi:hypothetical protein